MDPSSSNANWKWMKFYELTVSQLYDVLMLRAEVFVVEQNCVFNDLDNFDKDALHLLGYASEEKLVAYCRCYSPNAAHVHVRESPESSIGRVVTNGSYRGCGLGKSLMNEAITKMISSYPDAPIRIGAQRYLSKFYTALGFINEGEPYDEDGIPHIDMIYNKHINN